MTTTESLNKYFKKQNILETNIGNLTYVKILGEGGNSFVFQFKKENKDFAIKFLKTSDSNKLKRFKDEYFCAMQIATHKNIVQTYHFDSVLISHKKYFIIVMKHYQGTLNYIGNVKDEDKGNRGWDLFCQLTNALHHLHENKIFHRDIKPQNIFFDDEINEYVLGDLGIAHFSTDIFPKESKTKPSDKMANFSFSAPEQLNSKNLVKETSDIYSLGQVLHWYLTGETIRGLGRQREASNESPEKLKWLDAIIEKCLINNPDSRFQNISEIFNHVKKLKNPPRKNPWDALHEFDDVIRRSFSKINEVLLTKDFSRIKRFIDNFNEQCKVNDFWYMDLNGGDNTCGELTLISGNKWLFCNYIELDINSLLVYRDSHYPYKNFFILLLNPSLPFNIVKSNGEDVPREIPQEWSIDIATYWNGKYIDHNETRNAYYELEEGGDVVEVNQESFNDRMRHLQNYAYIIVPQGTATAIMRDRKPTELFLQDVVANNQITDEALKKYLDATRHEHSSEITKYN